MENQERYSGNDCPVIYNTQEEWNKNVKYLNNLTPSCAPFERPEMFPCIAFVGGFHDDPNGPFKQHYTFIYNFMVAQ